MKNIFSKVVESLQNVTVETAIKAGSVAIGALAGIAVASLLMSEENFDDDEVIDVEFEDED